MQTISEVMSREVRFVSAQASLQQAARLMDELDIGAIPVCNGERLVGVVTERDIAARGVPAGKIPEAVRVEEVMSSDVQWCFEDQSLEEVMREMADVEMRRIPVVSHDEQHRLVGILALGDLATRASPDGVDAGIGDAMEKTSDPGAAGGGDVGDRQAAGDAARGPAAHEEARYSGFAHKELASMAPDKGTAAGPGSTHDIGTAAATGLGAASTGAGNTVSSGGIATPAHTSAPARNLEDAAGGPSSPASPTVRQDQSRT